MSRTLQFFVLFLAAANAQEMSDEESERIMKKRLEKRLARQSVVRFPPPGPISCNADFADSEGFDCQLYEQGNWCNGTASPMGFGTEWCKTWDKKQGDGKGVCASQGFNWGHFTGFENSKYEEADNQCAGCGATSCKKNYKRTVPAYPEGCKDYETVEENGGGVWTDSWGYSCNAYHQGQFCKQKADGTWTEGGLWPIKDFGKISTYGWFHKGCTSGKACKITAYTACCSCGGGKKANQTSATIV
jgi:hypothetical protein